MDKKFLSDSELEKRSGWFKVNEPGQDYDVASMECLFCGASMVRRYASGVYLSEPPRRELQWWCRCGVTHCIRFEVIPGSCREKPSWATEWEEANPEVGLSHA